MSLIGKLKKDELKLVAEELGLTVPEGAKVVDLKNLIENSDVFADIELVKSAIDSVVEEKKVKKSDSEVQLELEKIKLAQLERELELANIRKESLQNTSLSTVTAPEIESSNNSIETLIKSVKTLTIPVPSRIESFNLFFQSLEKAFKTKNVPDEWRPEILLNILGERANNLLIYVSEEDLSNYDKLKSIVLKEFQPTPQECLNNFRKAQKLPAESYVQFASRLSAAFEYYCQLRKVNEFKSLCELVVSDKMFSSLERDLMTHIGVKQGESYFKPHELGRECDIYLSSKGKIKTESNVSTKPFAGNENKRFEGNKQQKSHNFRFQKGVSNVFLSEVKNVKCVLCKNSESHALQACPQFKNLSVHERVEIIKKIKACFKCFSPECSVKQCRARNCFCGKPHHKLIHFPRDTTRNNLTPAVLPQPQAENSVLSASSPPFVPNENHQSIVATSFAKDKIKKVLLSTVRVLVKNKYSEWQEVRCLLDVGSEACLISKECVERLRIKSEKINTLISCLNDSSMVVNGCIKTTISNKDKSFEKELSMLVVGKITDLIPHTTFDVHIEVPDFVPLADYSFNIPGKIDMLLGAEIFYELLRPGQIYVQNSQIRLQNTVFGYVASGSIDQTNEARVHCGLIRDGDLNKTLKEFWETENIEVETTKGKENSICEEHYVRTHWRNREGRYVVSMPLKDDPSCLGQSRDMALKRLKSLWNRFSKDNEYLTLYRDFLKEYEKLGHMREVVEEKVPEVAYYATHHAVYRPEKTSTKLRVVFNCSSLTTNGISLNAIQYNGGVIQEDLFTIMIRFREHIFALTADIKMMYRMILIDPSQHSLQRILWSDSADEPPKTYELNTVTYGTVSAPFLAMRTLQQLSLDEESSFPIAASVLRDSFYMDDVLCGASTLEKAKELQQQLVAILQKAGMQLHKWCANHPELSPNSKADYSFVSPAETKTLGVSWKPLEDCFSFRVQVSLSSSYTKRSVLSSIARLFDPLGLLGPIVAKAKIFMQRLWRLKIDWNEPLPDLEYREWHQFLVALEGINNIDIERRILIEQAETVEIHGFADASERCYGAAVYCKSRNASGTIVVKLITSKSRVAPLKSLTIPRLELCAAVLLSKLVKRVLAALKMMVTQVYLWSDSVIVLSWIQKEPMDLKTFVQNRVATIQELTFIPQWRHVSTEQNPADLLSRGVDPDKLLHHELWWKGPSFLASSDYPNQAISIKGRREQFNSELKNSFSEDSEDKLSVLNMCVNNFVNDLIAISNNYLTVLRVLSYIFRFVTNLRSSVKRESGPLTAEELDKAETFLVKNVQREAFLMEVQSLQRQGSVLSKSKLKTLNPFLDSCGVLRVGGRLGNTNFTFKQKHPAVLPKDHKLTNMIIEYFHKKYLHVGAFALLNHVRERFWLLSGRSICRKVVHKCIICFKAKPRVSTQLMGNLPKDRVVPDYPFNCSGLDFCGPFFIKNRGQRKGALHKVYVCIFICFVFKAVHIELVSDLTSESFIATLKRFMARRGKCAKLYSDNAKNFVGANKEIKRLQDMVRKPDEKLAGYFAAEGIEWKFIPPRAPNFGGLWEAAIKVFKYHLKRVVRGINLNFEEFLTVIVQIEGILNSRPLCPLSTNEDDFEVLTPAHFLVKRSLNSIAEPDLTNVKDTQLKRWQKITKTVQLMWKHWHRNYLSQLQQRSKWMFEKDNIHVGDLVLLIEDNLPTYKWSLGRIMEVYHGDDGKIRVAKVKTQFGTCKRAISKICVLPISK